MITPSTGNLLHARADALVNTVNCVGVMGKGIALQFKQAFPAMYKAYRKACDAGQVVPGQMHVYSLGSLMPPRYIINFPTKRHWRSKSRMGDIDDGLVDLARVVRELGLRSIAVPPLGSGNGGLNWAEVRPRIVAAFADQPGVEVLVYEPRGEPVGASRRKGPAKPKLTLARALFIRLMQEYKVPDYSLTQLEIQKLAYFLQEAGQPLRLEFAAHIYGPYAHNLNHVLRVLEGHFLEGAIDTRPGTEVRLLAGAEEAAFAFLAGHDAELERLKRVGDLIEGFETPYGMELLATVHWLLREDPSLREDPATMVVRVREWNERKAALMNPRHIEVALSRLVEQGWAAA